MSPLSRFGSDLTNTIRPAANRRCIKRPDIRQYLTKLPPRPLLKVGLAHQGASTYTLGASDKHVANVSQRPLRPPPMRWRSTPATAPENPFNRASRSAVRGGVEA